MENIKDLSPKAQTMFLGLLSKVDVNQTKQGKPFLKMEFMDSTGTVDGVLWNASSEKTDEISALSGSVVRIIAAIKEYQGVLQVVVAEIIAAPNESVSEFIHGEAVHTDRLMHTINETIDGIQDGPIRSVVSGIMKTHEDEFKAHTAARHVHHNYPGGLLQHTADMVEKAKMLMDTQYDNLNRDIVLGAIVLHDVGKLYEITDFPYENTHGGHLFGHIMMVNDLIIEAMTTHDYPIVYESNTIHTPLHLMRHTVLAHHGCLEWGSPVHPRIPEALFVHQVDKMDADHQIMRKGLSTINGGTSMTSQRVFGFGSDNGYLIDTEKEIRTD